MNRRFKFYLVVLLALLLAAGAGMLFYLSSSREAAQSRARFAAAHAEPLRRAETLLQQSVRPSAPARKPESHSPKKQVSPSTPAAASGRQVDILAEILKLPSYGSFIGGNVQLEWSYSFSYPYPLKAAEVDGHGCLSPAGVKNVLTYSRSFLLTQRYVEFSPARKNNNLLQDIIWKKSERTILGAPLRGQLDRLETLLLDTDWAIPDTRNVRSSRVWGFRQTHLLAILRALSRGEAERAARLLVRGLEFYKLATLSDYPKDFDRENCDYAQILTLLGELPGFPSSGLARAAGVLESMRMTPQQEKDLRQAHALRWSDSARLEMPRQRENIYHFIHVRGISPDSLMFELLRPKFAQTLQTYAAAWEARDKGGMKRALTAAQRLGVLANIKPVVMRDTLRNIDDNGYDGASADPDLWRLAAAVARYRRETGHYPPSRETLAPNYLAPPDAAAKDGWRVDRLDAWTTTTAQFGPLQTIQVPELPVYYRVRQYRRLVAKYKVSKDLPLDPRYDGWAEDIQEYNGYHPAGNVWVVEIRGFPITPEFWEVLLEQFRRADREAAISKIPTPEKIQKIFPTHPPRRH